ncbi:scavenger receptor cysteine-rich type 1 protein M130-like isoform X2 [Scomber scombrus]|uniref:scavenger receptor cysteine-rich type 1 protein M130-like isoform X2 n=1 Tax=Scomber scombrus TaxID=13677 RepID=UPI002DD86D1F|nr:scavenger receptor cysteine-rich type 1 protein M130-like isoform X2 [Scomber scombrus]
MDLLLMLLLLLWSSGLQAEDKHQSTEPVRLVGGASRCAGTLEVKHGEWRPVRYSFWTLKEAAVACRELDCGSAVSTGRRFESSRRPVWRINPNCLQSGSALRDCASSHSSSSIMELTCSDSVRLVNGTSLCSGRLEVKSEQLWSSVCEAEFDQQDAEVVCRELGCGAPSVLQGALYGEVEAPMWTKEFQCGGNESALLDCRRSDSARRTCSPGKAVGLTCSEPVRLVGGASRCAGTLEVKQGEWRPVSDSYWTLKEAAVACRELDCGSAVSKGRRDESSYRPAWRIRPDCLQSGSALRYCSSSGSSSSIMELTCSDLLLQPISSLYLQTCCFSQSPFCIYRPAASANHLCVSYHGRGLRGPAAGVSGSPGLQLHHQLLRPASVPRRLLPAHLHLLQHNTQLHPASCQSLC